MPREDPELQRLRGRGQQGRQAPGVPIGPSGQGQPVVGADASQVQVLAVCVDGASHFVISCRRDVPLALAWLLKEVLL